MVFSLCNSGDHSFREHCSREERATTSPRNQERSSLLCDVVAIVGTGQPGRLSRPPPRPGAAGSPSRPPSSPGGLLRPPPRELARARTEAEILRLGREQLATVGPANLSLRAIALALGIVSSAIYRYVRSREELLTLLIIDGYTSLGEEGDQAVAAVPKKDHRGRFFALGHAVRDWALAEPARYGLLYGTPVPGYDAPGERTTGPGTRVVVTLAGIAEQAW